MEREQHPHQVDPWSIWPYQERGEPEGVDLDTIRIVGAILGLLFGMPACIGLAAFLVLTFGFWALGAAMLALLVAMWVAGKAMDVRAARQRREDGRGAARARAAMEARRGERTVRRAAGVKVEVDEVEDLDRLLAEDFRRGPKTGVRESVQPEDR